MAIEPPRSPPRLALTFFIAGALLNCSEAYPGEESDEELASEQPGAGTLGEDSRNDEYEESSDQCHYDCFGYTECRDGTLTVWEHTPVPCEYWEGECPHYTASCSRGCSIRPTDIGPRDDPTAACEENRPKVPGDHCIEESWCWPQVPTIDVDGNVHSVHLECDLVQQVCVEIEPPEVDGYLEHCGLTNIDIQNDVSAGYAYGYAESEQCAGDLCLISQSDECLWQGCTIICDADNDCPQGSLCVEGLGNRAMGASIHGASVCKPGRRNEIGRDLVCLP